MPYDPLAPYRETTTDGSLPTYAWPGGYPLFYLTNDGSVVCPKCANDPDTSDPVVFADINWEDASLYCDDKGERIESAYTEDCPVEGCFGSRDHASFGPEDGWHISINNTSFRADEP